MSASVNTDNVTNTTVPDGVAASNHESTGELSMSAAALFASADSTSPATDNMAPKKKKGSKPAPISKMAAVQHTRSPSPTHPPISPITPPPGASSSADETSPPNFAQDRQTYTHNTHPAQVPILSEPPRPPPDPIDFETNPDVLALKNAISILQMQKRRAEGDIVALNRAKEEAIARPEEFLEHLKATDETLMKNRGTRADREDGIADGSSDDASDDSEDDEGQAASSAWSDLPKPQNIVRCPPINWAQYAVVGESLDKLHAEQVNQPMRGQPATIQADGTFTFQAGLDIANPEDGTKLVGVAAPYVPGRDKIGK